MTWDQICKKYMKKYYEFVTERYDPLPLANWQQDGFPFDYNSVMLSTFYDNNLKSLDALVENYDPSEYSIVKNSDNSRNVYEDKSEIIKTSMYTIFLKIIIKKNYRAVNKVPGRPDNFGL